MHWSYCSLALSPQYILDLMINEPADVLAPQGWRPCTHVVLTIELGMFSFNFLWQLMIQNNCFIQHEKWLMLLSWEIMQHFNSHKAILLTQFNMLKVLIDKYIPETNEQVLLLNNDLCKSYWYHYFRSNNWLAINHTLVILLTQVRIQLKQISFDTQVLSVSQK